MKTNLRARFFVLAAGLLWGQALPACGSSAALDPGGGGAGVGGGGSGADAPPTSSGAAGSSSGATGSGSGAAGSASAACSCAPGGAMDVIACGSPWPSHAGRDAPDAVVTPDGETVAMNRCAPGANGGCGNAVYRWTHATGTTKLSDSGWVFAISADGNTVLAERNPGDTATLTLWKDGTTTDLPFGAAPGHLLSVDGSTVVSKAKTTFGVEETARWTAAGGLEPMGDLPTGPVFSEPLAMTPDGSAIVGYGNTTAGQEPVLWTASGKMVDLLTGEIPAGIQSVARAISADGKTVVGTNLPFVGGAIFRWTAAGGAVGLTDWFASFPGPTGYFFIWGPRLHVSADGAVVAGTTRADDIGAMAPSAFRWTQATGVVALTPRDASIVRGASADGRRVLGSRVTPSVLSAPFSIGHRPFVWDEANGARDLAALLQQGGANLGGVLLGDPIALSADGRTVVGHAACEGGSEIIYRVTLTD